MFTARIVMRRNAPRLLSQWAQLSPKISIRTEHQESTRPALSSSKPQNNRLYKEKSRFNTPTHALPILSSDVPSPTAPEKPPDLIAAAINQAANLEELLSLGITEEKRMEEKHLVAILRSIFDLQRRPESRYRIEHLQNHEGFIRLCQKLRKLAPTLMTSKQLVTSLKTLMMCDVAPNSKVMQTVLHAIRNKVNELELEQVMYLSFLLKKMDDPLARALRIALPVVFETQLEIQLPTDNTNAMCNALEYATKVQLPAAKLQFIANRLLGTHIDSWTSKNACAILSSLGRIQFPDEHGLLPLMDTALERLARLVDRADWKELDWVVTLMGDNHSYRNPFWFKESLCAALASRIVRDERPLHNASNLARTFAKMAYANFEFLEYFSRLIVDSSSSSNLPSNVLTCFAVANYKPENFERLVDVVIAYENGMRERMGEKELREHSSFRLVLDCAVLGVYPQPLIRELFSESYLNGYFTAGKPSNLDWLQLDVTNRAVQIECPEYTGPKPSPTLIKQAHKYVVKFNQNVSPVFPLEPALQKALGGSSYLTSGLLTEFGHYIDHMVVLRPGGFPVAINTEPGAPEAIRYVEDVRVPDGCKRLFFKVFRHSSNAYASNGDRLRGIHELDLRTLEKAGHDVIPIHLEKWQGLLDYEKIPYLMRQIRERGYLQQV